nr:hypothetical protein [candidate division Zixibacteria bacterium]
MKATTSSHKSGFFIGVTCPGCGGDLELQADFFVLTCQHCGSHLRIVMPETPPVYLVRSEKPNSEIRFQIDRFLKQNNLPLTRSDLSIRSIYYPYWKIDAVVLKVRNKIVERYTGQQDNCEQEITCEQHMTDIRLTPYIATVAAGVRHDYIPQTIGMRTEYIRMVPFSRENVEDDFGCLPILKTWEQARTDLQGAISAIGKIDQADFGKNKTELFHPIGSLLYFPYYLAESPHRDTNRFFIIDGVTGRVVKHLENMPEEDFLFEDDLAVHESSSLQVDFHRCPECGFDLPTDQSYIYICDNCRQLIMMDKTKLTDNGLAQAVSDIGPHDRLFPFWSFGLSDPDMVRFRPVIGGIHDSNRLVIPAFKFPNLESLYKLTRRISSAYPKLDLTPLDSLDGRFARVTLGLEDACTLAEVVIYRDRIQKGIRSESTGWKFEPAEVSLFYTPFHPESYFYVDSILGAVTFEKKTVPC